MAIILPIVAAWNSKGLDKAIRDIQRAEGSFNKFVTGTDAIGTSMKNAGRSLTTNLTLPLAVAGGAAVNLAIGFDSSMTKIVSLVGIASDEVNGMRKEVLNLSGETGKAPKELADGLFVLTSAGLRGNDALSALEFSAKASASGLGETNDIARAVAGAMNAYGSGVVDAATATDIITATARAGNFEVSQFSGALGKVLPFAKQAGASLEDVGGAVALLTRTNGDAAVSVTQVQALLRAFVVPTAEAAKALNSVGLSAEDMRNAIATDGLPAALEMLDEKLGGNREQLGRLLGSSEGASAAFQILDADAEALAGTFGVTNDALGMTQDAFDTTSETAGFKLQKSLNGLKTVAIELGDILVPFVEKFARGIEKITDKFNALSPGAKDFIVNIALMAAAIGPLLMLTGSLLTSVSSITSVLGGVGKAMGIFGGATSIALGPVLLIALAIGGLILIFVALWRESEVFRDAVKKAFESVKEAIKNVVDTVKAKLDENKASLDTLKEGFKALGDFIGKYIVPIFEVYLVTAIGVLGNMIGWIIDYVVFMIDVWKRIIDTIKSVITFFGRLKDSFFEFLDAVGKANERIKNIGTNLVEGIKDGINDAWTNFKKWFTDKLGQPIQWAKKVLGISSPSKVFAKIGVDTMAGYIKGVESMSATLDSAVSEVALDSTVAMSSNVAMNPSVTLNGSVPSGSNAAPRSTANIFNLTVNAGIGSDGAVIGREIVDAIKRYERTSGPVFASA
jgi:TP901 family phage tail tape measure protein